MKIGILTFYYCRNFGAVLQAFALKSSIESLGNNAFFVDYKIPSLVRRYTLFSYYREKSILGNMKGWITALSDMKNRYIRIKKFNCFRRVYLNEEKVKRYMDVNGIIVGSDQVWNPKLTYGYDRVYWGEMVKKNHIPHYTYAVSCPSMNIVHSVSSYLENFRYIGVREVELQLKLEKCFGITTELNVDPTLLFDAQFYENLITHVCVPKRKYLFSYNLMGLNNLDKLSVQYAKEKTIELIDQHDNFFRSAGPLEFLSLIKHADMVFVSSFHGAVFSILFHKPFKVFLSGDERDERIKSLLRTLDLGVCIYDDNLNLKYNIDWSSVDERLLELRKKSFKYLEKIMLDCKKERSL